MNLKCLFTHILNKIKTLNNNVIAFFDFDGTITKKDSFLEFLKYSKGKIEFIKVLIILSPLIISFFFNKTTNQSLKEAFLRYYFNNWEFDKFKTIAENYSINEIDKIIKPKALKRIKWHQNNGHKVVVVSASIESWLKIWCQKNNLKLIATKLEKKGNKITGKFDGKNCYGPEKVIRIKESYNLQEFTRIYSYGNSSGDFEMLKIANNKYFKIF